MNGEQILDAISLLDDDLIEATEKLRSRKSKPYWMPAVAAAACICILFFGARGNAEAPMAADSAESHYSNGVQNEMKESPMETIAPAIDQITDTTVNAELCITELTENSLTGINKSAYGRLEDAVQIKIICQPELIAELQLGDWVAVRYTPGEENLLVDLEHIPDPEG